MAGVILETVSNRKLIAFGVILLIVQIVMYLVGGIIAPKPYYPQAILGTICVDTNNQYTSNASRWFYPRGSGDTCHKVNDLDDPWIWDKHIDSTQIVFTFQWPLPRDNLNLTMSRWFQNIVTVLNVNIIKEVDNIVEKDAYLTMDARLGYRDKGDTEWTEIVRSIEQRKLECHPQDIGTDYQIPCELLSFFELGVCHHEEYLVNVRLPKSHGVQRVNTKIGALKSLEMVSIHQNGGFTKVWVGIKTAMCPAILIALGFFWKRVAALNRQANLLERTLIILGMSITVLNLPIELMSLWVHMPFLLLFTDIRQGVVYSVLLCFWIIFTGEHLMDQLERNRLVAYWKHLTAVVFGCICLFVFEMCERGVQMMNPFFTIWSTDKGTQVAYAFISLAGIAACCYFILLTYMTVKVFLNIRMKKSLLAGMSKARRKYYKGVIYRFNFLLFVTLVCAALTVIFFIMGQASDAQVGGGHEPTLQYTSAFLTGVYGMWNIYVFALLILYAPSHKTVNVLTNGTASRWDARVRRDLSKLTKDRPLKVTTIGYPPYVFRSDDQYAQGNDRYSGYIPELLTILSTRYNFSFVISEVRDSKWGSTHKSNGSWTGMVGEVIRGEMDMAAAPLTITAQREKVLDFVKPFGSFGLTILLKKPNVTDFNYTFNILEPLSMEVWFLLIVSFVVTWLFTWVMNCFNPYEHSQVQRRQMIEEGTTLFGIGGSFWYIWTLTNWQGFDRSPRSVASKILSCFWMCFVTFVLITYTGSAVNHLFWASTVHGRNTGQHPIRNFRDLVMRKGDFKYGTIKDGSTYNYFTQDTVLEEFKTMKSYWEENGNEVLMANQKDALEKVRNDKYGFIMEELSARYEINMKPCDLMTVGRLGQRNYGFALAPGSPYLEHFHTAILEMTEAGDIDALERKWFVHKGECWRDAPNDEDADSALHLNKPLRVNHKSFWSILIFLACGLFLSGVAAVAEILYFKYRGRYAEHQKARQQPLVGEIDPQIVSS